MRELPRRSRRRTSYLNLGGHPIHALWVPVPIGFYVSAFVSAVMMARHPGDAFWRRATRLSGIAAVITAGAAAAAGLVDLLTLVRRPKARMVGLGHLVTNSLALILQLIALTRGPQDPKRYALLQSGVLALVGVAGFLGGDLTYRHRIGVFGGRRRRWPRGYRRVA